MKFVAGAGAFALVASLAGMALAQAGTPAEAVAARQALMYQLDAELVALEIAVADGSLDAAAVPGKAANMAAMLQAFPFLFPAESNFLAQPDSEIVTAADPRIWSEPEAFSAVAAETVAAAQALSTASTVEAAAPAVASLRATCDSCHATYLQYQSPFGLGGTMAPAEPAADY